MTNVPCPYCTTPNIYKNKILQYLRTCSASATHNQKTVRVQVLVPTVVSIVTNENL